MRERLGLRGGVGAERFTNPNVGRLAVADKKVDGKISDK
jgi:hypothetical protein